MDWLSNDGCTAVECRIFESCAEFDSTELFDYKQFYELSLMQVIDVLDMDMERKDCEYRATVTKNNAKSSELRKKGNKEFEKSHSRTKNLIKALELYTKSIGLAALGGKELALAYSSRAVVLFKLNRFTECLQDLERALELKSRLDDKNMAKVEFNKAECLQKLALQCYAEAQCWLTKIPLNDNLRKELKQKLKHYPAKSNEAFLEEQASVVPKIEHPNKRFPCASDAIDVKYSKAYGRHVVATRDVDVGEVLIVEKPYHKDLSNDMRYLYCNFCLRVMWAGIPCEHCTCTFYCSEECKTSAWEIYHQYECPFIHFIKPFEYHNFEECAVRLFFHAMHEAGGLEKLKGRIENLGITSDEPVWPLKDEWYQNSRLESVFTQITNVHKVGLKCLRWHAVSIIRLTFMLACTTDFFGTRYNWSETPDWKILDSMLYNEDVKFVGGQLIKLSLIVINNTQAMADGSLAEGKKVTFSNKRIVWSLGALLNYSCFSNISIEYKRDCTIYYAVLPIKKGEQIYLGDGMEFSTESLGNRQEHWKNDLCFTCTCIVCKEEWQDFTSETENEINLRPGKTTKDEKYLKQVLIPAINKARAEISDRLKTNDFRQKDDTLRKLYDYMAQLYGMVKQPNYETILLKYLIRKVHLHTGVMFIHHLTREN